MRVVLSFHHMGLGIRLKSGLMASVFLPTELSYPQLNHSFKKIRKNYICSEHILFYCHLFSTIQYSWVWWLTPVTQHFKG